MGKFVDEFLLLRLLWLYVLLLWAWHLGHVLPGLPSPNLLRHSGSVLTPRSPFLTPTKGHTTDLKKEQGNTIVGNIYATDGCFPCSLR